MTRHPDDDPEPIVTREDVHRTDPDLIRPNPFAGWPTAAAERGEAIRTYHERKRQRRRLRQDQAAYLLDLHDAGELTGHSRTFARGRPRRYLIDFHRAEDRDRLDAIRAALVDRGERVTMVALAEAWRPVVSSRHLADCFRAAEYDARTYRDAGRWHKTTK